jgi:3-dehydroquinate dehydratase
MFEDRDQAKTLVDLLRINEDDTRDPIVIAAMAHTHAMLALIEAIENLQRRD